MRECVSCSLPLTPRTVLYYIFIHFLQPIRAASTLYRRHVKHKRWYWMLSYYGFTAIRQRIDIHSHVHTAAAAFTPYRSKCQKVKMKRRRKKAEENKRRKLKWNQISDGWVELRWICGGCEHQVKSIQVTWVRFSPDFEYLSFFPWHRTADPEPSIVLHNGKPGYLDWLTGDLINKISCPWTQTWVHACKFLLIGRSSSSQMTDSRFIDPHRYRFFFFLFLILNSRHTDYRDREFREWLDISKWKHVSAEDWCLGCN